MPSAIKISYHLNPPVEVQAGNLEASKTSGFSVDGSPSEGYAKYYGAPHKAIEEAKDCVGNELTAWRDAVGKAELNKETTKTLKYDADEEGGESDDPDMADCYYPRR